LRYFYAGAVPKNFFFENPAQRKSAKSPVKRIRDAIIVVNIYDDLALKMHSLICHRFRSVLFVRLYRNLLSRVETEKDISFIHAKFGKAKGAERCSKTFAVQNLKSTWCLWP
jgi:hypothetical protein